MSRESTRLSTVKPLIFLHSKEWPFSAVSANKQTKQGHIKLTIVKEKGTNHMVVLDYRMKWVCGLWHLNCTQHLFCVAVVRLCST